MALVGQIVNRAMPDQKIVDVPILLMAGKDILGRTRSNQFGEFQLEYEPRQPLILHVPVERAGEEIEVRLQDLSGEVVIVGCLRAQRSPAAERKSEEWSLMKKQMWMVVLTVVAVLTVGAQAQTRYILRPATPNLLDSVAQKFQLTPVEPVDGGGNVWVVTASSSRPPAEVEKEVDSDTTEVTDFELDQPTASPEVSQSTAAILDSLPTPSSISYYGSNVLDFYTTQPAATLIRLADTQTTFGTLGAGIMAIIDTGIDPSHPVLSGSIVPGGGYDFVNNWTGASEWVDLTKDVKKIFAGSSPIVTSKNTVAMVSQSTAAISDHRPRQSSTSISSNITCVCRRRSGTGRWWQAWCTSSRRWHRSCR